MDKLKSPWSAYSGEDTNNWWIIVDSDGYEIGSCDGGFEKEQAFMMAKAPEMYEALDSLLTAIKRGQGQNGPFLRHVNHIERLLAEARGGYYER